MVLRDVQARLEPLIHELLIGKTVYHIETGESEAVAGVQFMNGDVCIMYRGIIDVVTSINNYELREETLDTADKS